MIEGDEMQEEKASLGSRVKEARLERGLKAKQLAAMIGVSAGHISKIEKGTTSPSAPLMRVMSQVLGVTERWLQGFDDDILPPPAAAGRTVSLKDGELASLAVQVDQAEEKHRSRIKSLVRGALAMLSVCVSVGITTQSDSLHNLSSKPTKSRKDEENGGGSGLMDVPDSVNSNRRKAA